MNVPSKFAALVYVRFQVFCKPKKIPPVEIAIIAIAMTANILFHQFKHHLPHIKAWVERNIGKTSHEAIQTIKTLGSSQFDMYCGSLSVDEILQQVGCYLIQLGITENEQYGQWVGNGYKLCTLTDGSVFTLRYIVHAKPVHIHPARHAPYTIRIKANALKSVICYMLAEGAAGSLSIHKLNALRMQYLGLPPVSETGGITEMERLAKLLALPPFFNVPCG
jgi:hypothetical protein